MKNKFFKILLLFAFAFAISTDYCLAQQEKCIIKEADKGKYHLLESIPGVGEGCTVVEFPDYISKLYKFSFVAIALSALLMITIGGFYWLMSAGNQSVAGTAKKLITDALIGLGVALVSWLILNTINPDILKGELDTSVMKVENIDNESKKENKKEEEEEDDNRYYDEEENVSKTELCGSGVCECAGGATPKETSSQCETIKKYGGSWSCMKDSERTACAQKL